MAVTVVDCLEIIDVEQQHRQRLAALRGLLEQRLQVACHIAAVVERRQRVENGHFDRFFEPRPQIVGVTLALDLGAHPRHQLVGIDRAHDIVVDAHIEAPEQLGVVARLDDDHDRQMPRAVERAHLRAQSQAVGLLEAEADDQQVEIAVGKLQQGAGHIGFALDLMLLLQRPPARDSSLA